jgi:hypothetical protein
MSKQDIKKRLGFAAQGVKDIFAADWLPQISQMLKYVSSERHRVTMWISSPTTVKVAGAYRQSKSPTLSPGAAIPSNVATYLYNAAGIPNKYNYTFKENSPKEGQDTLIITVDGLPAEIVSYLKAWGIGSSPKSFAGFKGSRPGVKTKMAAPKKNVGHLAVTNSEYAALAASDAAGKRISSNSQYQITSEDRAIMAAGKAAAKSALARHDAWDKAWRNAPNDAARAKVEAEAEKAESGMKKYPVTRLHFARPGAKAKFDREVGRKGNKSAMITKNGPDADASWLAYVVQHHGEGQGESVLGTMRSYSTEARAKAAALRGLETSGLRGGFARPGVKAKA